MVHKPYPYKSKHTQREYLGLDLQKKLSKWLYTCRLCITSTHILLRLLGHPPHPPPFSLGHRTVNLAAYSLHLGFPMTLLRGRDVPWDGAFMTTLAFYCCDLGSIPRPNVALWFGFIVDSPPCSPGLSPSVVRMFSLQQHFTYLFNLVTVKSWSEQE